MLHFFILQSNDTVQVPRSPVRCRQVCDRHQSDWRRMQHGIKRGKRTDIPGRLTCCTRRYTPVISFLIPGTLQSRHRDPHLTKKRNGYRELKIHCANQCHGQQVLESVFKLNLPSSRKRGVSHRKFIPYKSSYYVISILFIAFPIRQLIFLNENVLSYLRMGI